MKNGFFTTVVYPKKAGARVFLDSRTIFVGFSIKHTELGLPIEIGRSSTTPRADWEDFVRAFHEDSGISSQTVLSANLKTVKKFLVFVNACLNSEVPDEVLERSLLVVPDKNGKVRRFLVKTTASLSDQEKKNVIACGQDLIGL